MAVIFIPLYIEYLGIEAYGLIGFFLLMQTLIFIFDMGISATINREMARYTSGKKTPKSIVDLLRSFELIITFVAFLLGVIIWSISDWIALYWFSTKEIPLITIVQVVKISSLVLGLRLIETVYRSAIIGLQKQVWLNQFIAVTATLRYGGVVVVLAFVDRSLEAFFLWNLLISVISVAILLKTTHNFLPMMTNSARFSYLELKKVMAFSGGMLAITVISLVLMQIDKIILSKMVPLAEFGVYVFSFTLASSLYTFVSPVVQAIYPRLVELIAVNNTRDLIQLYHNSAQLVSVITAPFFSVMVCFSYGIVFSWSGDSSLAKEAENIVIYIAIGTYLNCLMWVPYRTQLAFGWTSLTLWSNLMLVVLVVPAMFILVPIYGSIVAAKIWAIINLVYVLVLISFMHAKILKNEKAKWYIYDVIIPSSLSVSCVFFIKTSLSTVNYERMDWLILIVMSLILSGLISSISLKAIRGNIIKLYKANLVK